MSVNDAHIDEQIQQLEKQKKRTQNDVNKQMSDKQKLQNEFDAVQQLPRAQHQQKKKITAELEAEIEKLDMAIKVGNETINKINIQLIQLKAKQAPGAEPALPAATSDEVYTLKAKIEQLQLELQNSHQSNESMKSTIEDMQQELIEETENYKQLSDSLTRISELLRGEFDKNHILEAENEQLKHDNAQLQTDKAAADAQLQAIQKTVRENFIEFRAQNKEKWNTYSNVLDKFASALDELEQEINTFNADNADSNAGIMQAFDAMQKQMTAIQDTTDKSRKQMMQLQQDTFLCKTENTTLIEQLQQTRLRATKFHAKYSAREKECKELNAKITVMEQEHARLQTQKSAADAKLRTMQDKVPTLLRSLQSDYAQKIEDFMKSIEQFEEMILAMVDEVKTLNTQHEDTGADKYNEIQRTITESINDWEERKETLLNNVKQLEDEKGELTAANLQLVTKLAASAAEVKSWQDQNFALRSEKDTVDAANAAQLRRENEYKAAVAELEMRNAELLAELQRGLDAREAHALGAKPLAPDIINVIDNELQEQARKKNSTGQVTIRDLIKVVKSELVNLQNSIDVILQVPENARAKDNQQRLEYCLQKKNVLLDQLNLLETQAELDELRKKLDRQQQGSGNYNTTFKKIATKEAELAKAQAAQAARNTAAGQAGAAGGAAAAGGGTDNSALLAELEAELKAVREELEMKTKEYEQDIAELQSAYEGSKHIASSLEAKNEELLTTGRKLKQKFKEEKEKNTILERRLLDALEDVNALEIMAQTLEHDDKMKELSALISNKNMELAAMQQEFDHKLEEQKTAFTERIATLTAAHNKECSELHDEVENELQQNISLQTQLREAQNKLSWLEDEENNPENKKDAATMQPAAGDGQQEHANQVERLQKENNLLHRDVLLKEKTIHELQHEIFTIQKAAKQQQAAKKQQAPTVQDKHKPYKHPQKPSSRTRAADENSTSHNNWDEWRGPPVMRSGTPFAAPRTSRTHLSPPYVPCTPPTHALPVRRAARLQAAGAGAHGVSAPVSRVVFFE